MDGTPIFIGLMLFNYIYSPIDHITSMISLFVVRFCTRFAHLLAFFMNMYIRYNEFQADAFSVKLGYGKELKEGGSGFVLRAFRLTL
jgi:Zn-dependent protease with chaperone function